MSALEQEAQRRVLMVLISRQSDIQPKLLLGEWLKQATAFREQLAATYGSDYGVGSQELLEELREESSWPRSL